ncbi:MAG: glycosyltransferase [Clostridia bacterium]|nr:glycosyltransferase [Clostridia bacterium]
METIKKEHNFISAVVYVHNAANHIETFLNTLFTVLSSNFINSEIVVVNDASTDESEVRIRDFASRISDVNISLINMSYFHGLETAMTAGDDFAIGDYILEFDNTVLDFDSKEIMRVYQEALSGYDIVSASPDLSEKLSSQIFYSLFEHYSRSSVRLTTERFRIISRRAINRIASMNIAVIYRKAIYSNVGLKVKNVKYKTINNIAASVNKSEKKYRSALAIDSLILFTDLGYRFSISMTFIMMFMSIFMILYSIITYLLVHPVEGWTTTILFLSVAFFGLFGILTVIIKYLQIIINLVFKRKHYSYSSVDKLN